MSRFIGLIGPARGSWRRGWAEGQRLPRSEVMQGDP